MSDLIHELLLRSAQRTPGAEALVYGQRRLNYAELAGLVRHTASALLAAGLERGERVAVYLEKNIENVAAMFGAAAAGGAFVPVNPLLKPEQVAYILADCNVRVLVTSIDRLRLLQDALAHCRDLRLVVATGNGELPALPGVEMLGWDEFQATADAALRPHRAIDTDMAAILYTSGSTGKP
jgi:acyl-CoA synthetase (AMP-forming)/AMP-acid ligase II